MPSPPITDEMAYGRILRYWASDVRMIDITHSIYQMERSYGSSVGVAYDLAIKTSAALIAVWTAAERAEVKEQSNG